MERSEKVQENKKKRLPTWAIVLIVILVIAVIVQLNQMNKQEKQRLKQKV